MNKRQSSEAWPYSPWIGEMAPTQFALWHAGNEWAARAHWFIGPVGGVIPPINQVDPDKVIERPTDFIKTD